MDSSVSGGVLPSTVSSLHYWQIVLLGCSFVTWCVEVILQCQLKQLRRVMERWGVPSR